MSIIYEALKKVGASVDGSHLDAAAALPKKQARKRINKYLGYTLILCFGLFVKNIFFLSVFKPSELHSAQAAYYYLPAPEKAAAPAKQASREDKAPADAQLAALENTGEPLLSEGHSQDTQKKEIAMTLNGIFFSKNNGYYALVNNRIVRVGDTVNGAIVRHIDFDNVELESTAGEPIKLSRGR